MGIKKAAPVWSRFFSFYVVTISYPVGMANRNDDLPRVNLIVDLPGVESF